MTLRSAEEVAMDIARNGVEAGSLVLFHQTEAIIHADRLAVARRVLERLAERLNDRIAGGRVPHFTLNEMMELAQNPAELEKLLKETK